MAIAIRRIDPSSPDVVILEAYEKIRANKAWVYSFDDSVDVDALPEEEFQRRDDQQIAHEQVISASFATTIPGVVARLLSLAPQINQDRWIDRTLAQGGFAALRKAKDDLDHNTRQLVVAIDELLHIEWQDALAAYERSHADFLAVLKLKEIVDGGGVKARSTNSGSSRKLDDLGELADALEERFSNESTIRRLVQTLVPDHDAYLRKVEIVLAENLHDQTTTTWLAQDALFLLGNPGKMEA